MTDLEPKLVCFSCKFGWGFVAGEKELASKIKDWVPVLCSGKIDTVHVLNAFRQGADGVLILGCSQGDCHFQDGNVQTMKRMSMLQTVLDAHGIEKERVQMKMSLDPEGKAIPQLIKDMSNGLKKLGPVKKVVNAPKVAAVS